MRPEDEKEADICGEKIEQAIRTLSEHFDSVHIFANRHLNDNSGTVKWSLGSGNWYARYGQIREWVRMEETVMPKKEEEEE